MRNQPFFSVLLAGLLTLGLSTAASAQTGTPTGAPLTQKANGNLLQMSKLSANHTTLMKAVSAAGLDEQARGATKYTVFAPTNAAFDKLPAGKLDELLKPANKSQLALLLAYHVVPGSYLAANLKDGEQLTTVQGETLTVMRQGGTLMIKDSKGSTATVINTDIVAENGIIQSIDTVLMPTSLTAPAKK
ncbi:fasciclin domain-containing protein [Hymenobacter actinosclerus]|uniref:Uncaracterized surface protein containing fasciclin (FAS1) repeats n=1 Tax=Hymenobacter actinosclerus TaxID=82805 RepID=A0A1I0BLV3_9BACT|nr:fasciclin domain-containing protein [Hymenobacter actinosclerus]SET07644.1 Uncaracterized surface protein containing fasciclin (FAS1) repeats [Hymenobacter actinosclerus]